MSVIASPRPKVPRNISLKYHSIPSSRALLPKVDKADVADLVIFLSTALQIQQGCRYQLIAGLSIPDLGGWLSLKGGVL